jgi:hypothetical protein
LTIARKYGTMIEYVSASDEISIARSSRELMMNMPMLVDMTKTMSVDETMDHVITCHVRE